MAWIACLCRCGCRDFNHCKPFGPMYRTYGLCRDCKEKGHEMVRARYSADAIVSVHRPMQVTIFVGLRRVNTV